MKDRARDAIAFLCNFGAIVAAMWIYGEIRYKNGWLNFQGAYSSVPYHIISIELIFLFLSIVQLHRHKNWSSVALAVASVATALFTFAAVMG